MFTSLPLHAIRRSLCGAAVLAVIFASSGQPCFAAENVTELVDDGLNRIVADEVSEQMAGFLETYRVTDLKSVTIKGTFRSLTEDDLESQMTSSLAERGITVEGASNVRLEGTLVVTETRVETILLMECAVTEADRGELCTVRVRKVLPNDSDS